MTTFLPTHHPEIGERATATTITRVGDEKEVEVYDGTILDVDADERLVLLRLDAGGWQAFPWGAVSRGR